MVPVWQLRESQRQNLIDQLIQEVFEWEEKDPDDLFSFRLALVLMDYLRMRRLEVGSPQILGNKFEQIFFRENILPPIKQFSRLDVECDILIVQLFEKVLVSVFSHFRSELRKVEVDNPQVIFGTPSGTTEVEIT